MIRFEREHFDVYAPAVFHTDSPSGYSRDISALLCSYLSELGYAFRVHNKGTVEVLAPGLDDSRTVATSAHVDTLGLMVRSVK